MAKDRVEGEELASTAWSDEDPLRAMAEPLMDFVMEAGVAAKAGAEVYERSTDRANGAAPHRSVPPYSC